MRQRLVDGAPVVETAMRVPGGDAVAPGLRRARRAGGAERVVVEVENATPVPFAVALAVRPYGLTGAGPIRELTLSGATVTVDGRVAIVLPRPPATGPRCRPEPAATAPSTCWPAGPANDT